MNLESKYRVKEEEEDFACFSITSLHSSSLSHQAKCLVSDKMENNQQKYQLKVAVQLQEQYCAIQKHCETHTNPNQLFCSFRIRQEDTT